MTSISFTGSTIQTSTAAHFHSTNYTFVDISRNFADANAYCFATFGTFLATVGSTAQNTEALNLAVNSGASTNPWIGFNDIQMEGSFVWRSGSTVSFAFPWNTNEPNDGGGTGEDGVQIIVSGGAAGKWNDIDTDTSLQFLCDRDQDPPTVTLSSPLNLSYGTDPTLTYSVSDGATEVFLDGVLNVLSSGTVLSGLSEGSHSIRVESTDASDNTGSQEIYFTIDTSAPQISIISPTSGSFINENDIAIDYTVSDMGNIATLNVYSNDIANTTAFPSSTVFPDQSETLHNITIEAIDDAGNRQVETSTFTIDRTAPSVSIQSPGSDALATPPQLTYTASDGNVKVIINSLVNSTEFPSGSVLTGLPDGVHTVRVEATDQAGNVGYDEVTFTLLTTQPSLSITSPLTNALLNSDSVAVNYQTSGGGAEIYLNGVANTTAFESGSSFTDLDDGTYNLTIVVENDANVKVVSTIFLTIDTTAPIVSITSPTTREYTSVPLLDYSVSDGIVTVYLDGTTNTTAIPSGTNIGDYFTLASGIYNLTIIAVDQAGNIGRQEIVFVLDLDDSTETTPTGSDPPSETDPTDTDTSNTPISLLWLLSGISVVYLLEKRKFH